MRKGWRGGGGGGGGGGESREEGEVEEEEEAPPKPQRVKVSHGQEPHGGGSAAVPAAAVAGRPAKRVLVVKVLQCIHVTFSDQLLLCSVHFLSKMANQDTYQARHTHECPIGFIQT